MSDASTNQHEILHGYEEIASAIDGTKRQAREWARLKIIPTFKVGRKVCAKRSSIMAALSERERQSTPQRREPVHA